MKSETEPITDDEWLLRRVRVERFRTDKIPLISPNAFEPRIKGREPDRDGISLFREACLQVSTEILKSIPPDRVQEYGIVRIPVSLLKSLNLTVENRPDPHIRGHVVIRELNSVSYAAADVEERARLTMIKFRLAEIASEDANIVCYPRGNTSTDTLET